ncbi:phage tail tip lysozyme [Novosphingobium colocasiae]|uniref:phage tail tip lysozyme n=1 Tax=Novosphingobium colocasiae TaxID=1256513 RepID=UPI0035B01949
MSTNVLDAFLITFGLDVREFKSGEREVRDGSKRLRDDTHRTFSDMDRGSKQLGQSIKSVRNEVVGLGLAIMGARSITGLISNMMTGAATADRFGQSIGMSVQQIWAWRGAMKSFGGQAGDADNALQTMQNLRQGFMQGTLGSDQQFALARLGITGADLQNGDAGQLLTKLSGSSLRTSNPQLFASLLQQIGINGPVLYFLQKGQGAVEKLLGQNEKLADQQEELAKESEQVQAEMAELNLQLQKSLVPVLRDLVPVLTDLLGAVNGLLEYLPKGHSTGGVLSGAAAGGVLGFEVGGPWGAAAGALIGGVLGNSAGVKVNQWLHGGMGTETMPAAGGARKSPPQAFSGGRNPEAVFNYLRTNGIASGTALGLTAAIVGEGGLDARTGGGHKGRALGIGQLLGSRRAEFLKRYGPNFTLKDELDFLIWELRGGDHGGKSVLAERDPARALEAAVLKFFRPQGANNEKWRDAIGDIKRGTAWLRNRGSSIYVASMTVVANNPKELASALHSKTRSAAVHVDRGVAP